MAHLCSTSSGRKTIEACICTLVLLLLHGCIRSDLSKCKMQMRLYVVITGDEPARGMIPDGATMFVFDKDKKYTHSIHIKEETILENIPMEISYKVDNPPHIVIWGNMKNCADIPNLVPGTAMEQLLITFNKDEDGYCNIPGELYHGTKQLRGNDVEYVPISQKVGRIVITARGLAGSKAAQDYYFTVNTGYSEYNFSGKPVMSEATFRLPGALREHDLFTLPHNMVHHPQDCSHENAASVGLYETTGGTASLIASANSDSDGRPIIIESGKTTNVLLNLSEDGKLKISVSITNWDEILQWNEW